MMPARRHDEYSAILDGIGPEAGIPCPDLEQLPRQYGRLGASAPVPRDDG
jgi:hypothetical protein